MNMNENEELRNRISNSVSPESVHLPDYLVAQAAKAKPKRVFGFNQLRLGLGSLAAASLVMVGAFVLPSAFAPQPLFTMANGAQGGQALTLHGWVYGLRDGLLHDLLLTVNGTAGVDAAYRAAVAAVASRRGL